MPRLLASVFVVAALTCAWPRAAAAQPKEPFLRALVDFANAANGTYGDEGPALLAATGAMQAALAQWDAAVAKVESGFAAAIGGARPEAAARMRTALGSVYLDRGRLAEAIRQFDAAAALDPQLGEAHRLRGLALEAAGRHGDAAIALRTAWKHSRSPADAYLLLSSAAAVDADARAVLAAAAADTSPPAAFALPSANLLLLDESSLPGPLFLGAHYAPAVALLSAGQHAQGVARLRALAATDGLVADPALKTESAARLSAALRRNDPSGAIGEALLLVARHPMSAEAHRLLGVAYWVASRYAESLDALRMAVDLDPRDERSRLSIADVRFESRDAPGARAALEEAIRALPDSGLARWKLGTLQQTLGDEAAALRSLEAAAAVPLLGGASHLHAASGRLHHRRVDLDAAAAAYRRRARLVPNNAAAHVDLGEVLRAQEQLDAALAEYLAAALLDPSGGRALAMAGLVQASAGRDEDAMPLLRKAVTREPAHLEARYALARALLRLGRAEEGQRELALFQELQAKAMEEERQRYRDNQAKIDALLDAEAEKTPRR